MSLLALASGVDESKVTPGLLGFVVVALLGVATYLLIRSMNRQMRRIDLPDDEPQATEDPATPEPTGDAGDPGETRSP